MSSFCAVASRPADPRVGGSMTGSYCPEPDSKFDRAASAPTHVNTALRVHRSTRPGTTRRK